MSWQERLQQEWVTAQDDAARRYLLALYQEQIAKLSEHEGARLLESLQDTKRC